MNILQLIKNPKLILLKLDNLRIITLKDEVYLKILSSKVYKKKLDLNNPQTFNEKLQWLKLHDRNPEYTKMVDKYEVKKYIASIIGKEHIIPTLGVWNKFEEINFDLLPNKFVLKCTHDSGSIVICDNKESFDINLAKKKINKSLRKNYYYHGREWPYKDVKPRIICESYIGTESGPLNDYKFFVFSGKVYCIQVDYDRFVDHHRNFYDTNWNYLPFTTCYPTNENKKIEKPKKLEEVIKMAEKISEVMGKPKFLRIDFYIEDNFTYFGEVTFYHGNRF